MQSNERVGLGLLPPSPVGSAETSVPVLIADDSSSFRRAARELVEALDLEVAGEAASGEEAVRVAARIRPSIVLMDVRMPGLDGISAAQRIAAQQPGVTILLMTMWLDDDLQARAADGGFPPVISKQTLQPRTLANALVAAEALPRSG